VEVVHAVEFFAPTAIAWQQRVKCAQLLLTLLII